MRTALRKVRVRRKEMTGGGQTTTQHCPQTTLAMKTRKKGRERDTKLRNVHVRREEENGRRERLHTTQ